MPPCAQHGMASADGHASSGVHCRPSSSVADDPDRGRACAHRWSGDNLVTGEQTDGLRGQPASAHCNGHAHTAAARAPRPAAGGSAPRWPAAPAAAAPGRRPPAAPRGPPPPARPQPFPQTLHRRARLRSARPLQRRPQRRARPRLARQRPGQGWRALPARICRLPAGPGEPARRRRARPPGPPAGRPGSARGSGRLRRARSRPRRAPRPRAPPRRARRRRARAARPRRAAPTSRSARSTRCAARQAPRQPDARPPGPRAASTGAPGTGAITAVKLCASPALRGAQALWCQCQAARRTGRRAQVEAVVARQAQEPRRAGRVAAAAAGLLRLLRLQAERARLARRVEARQLLRGRLHQLAEHGLARQLGRLRLQPRQHLRHARVPQACRGAARTLAARLHRVSKGFA